MDEKFMVLREYINQSPNRYKVLISLSNNVLKPSDIAKDTDIHINNVSRALKQLRDKNLIYLLNPEAKKGRIYRITKEGYQLLNYL